ncbi:DUF559 domain-containing protein [Candidatus Saganbacteria bacterium]|nr:DUF559 domain-containing protein [Candidatus Saganbacteria bacterium]
MTGNRKRSILGARSLRKKSTDAEVLLWKYLSNKGMCGFKFRRQYPIGGFVIDFFCPQNKLGIEIDGKIHDNQEKQDSQRQSKLEKMGIEFLRFNNAEVFNNIDFVLKTIKRKLIPDIRPVNDPDISLLHEMEKGRKG